MSNSSRFWLGALGGILPLFVTTLAADIPTIYAQLLNIPAGIYVGFFIREIVLVVLGGITASLNTQVTSPVSLVQLGAAAPALVASYINGAAIRPPAGEEKPKTQINLILSPAYAEEIEFNRSVMKNSATEPRQIVVADFWGDVVTGMSKNLGSIAIGQSLEKKDK